MNNWVTIIMPLTTRDFSSSGLTIILRPHSTRCREQWLENELKKGEPAIIFAHRPLLSYQDGSPLPEAQLLLSLFDAYDVVMYMNGHWHESAEYTRNNSHLYLVR